MSSSGTTIKLQHYDAEAEETYTIDFTADKDSVVRVDERLDKEIGKMLALKTAKPRLHDHLQNVHVFVITYTAVAGGGKSAWEKKRELVDYMQKVGHTWKLTLTDTARGFDETYYVMCQSVDAPDIAGETQDMTMIIELLETENWEGQP